MKKKKHIFNWIFSVFCILCLPVYGLTFGSIIVGLIGVLSLPIEPIRNIWDMTPLHNGKLKVILFAILFIFGVSLLPNTAVEDSDKDNSNSRMIEAYEDETTEVITTEATTTEVTTTEVTTTEVATTEAITSETTTTASATTENITTELAATENVAPQSTYVLNTNTGKFHYPSCSSVDDMKDSNKAYHTGTRDEVIGMGYSPCGRCNP